MCNCNKSTNKQTKKITIQKRIAIIKQIWVTTQNPKIIVKNTKKT